MNYYPYQKVIKKSDTRDSSQYKQQLDLMDRRSKPNKLLEGDAGEKATFLIPNQANKQPNQPLLGLDFNHIFNQKPSHLSSILNSNFDFFGGRNNERLLIMI